MQSKLIAARGLYGDVSKHCRLPLSFTYLYQFTQCLEISHGGGNVELLFQEIIAQFASPVCVWNIHIGSVSRESKFFITKVLGEEFFYFFCCGYVCKQDKNDPSNV